MQGCRPCPRPLTQHGTGAAGLGIAGAVSLQAAAKPGCQTLAGTQAALCPPVLAQQQLPEGWEDLGKARLEGEVSRRLGPASPCCALRPATRLCQEAACKGGCLGNRAEILGTD